jgi:hypothetical protein
VWLKDKNGVIGVRLAKGTLETPAGKHNLKYVPHAHALPDGYFDSTVETVKSAIAVILELKREVTAELRKRK